MNSVTALRADPITSSIQPRLPGLVTRSPAAWAVSNRRNKLLSIPVNAVGDRPMATVTLSDGENRDVETLKFINVNRLINKRKVTHDGLLCGMDSRVIARVQVAGNAA